MTIETTSAFGAHNSIRPRVLIHASSHFTTVHQITHAQHSEYDVVRSKPLVTCKSTIGCKNPCNYFVVCVIVID